MESKTKKSSVYLIGIVFLLFGLVIGFSAGKIPFQPQQMQTQMMAENKPAADKSLYNSQTASITGQITAVNNKQLTVKNLVNGTTGTVTVSDRIKIIGQPGKTGPANSTSDLSSVELNQNALISLEMVNGEYQVILIQYIPANPTLPAQAVPAKTASPSTKLK